MVDKPPSTIPIPPEKLIPIPKIKKPVATRPETKFLSDAITTMQTSDDMEILTCLINLCETLSISSDQIADDPNMGILLQEVCKQLEKSYLTELIIYSLQCMNYILDINPAFASLIKKANAIPKIMILMSAVEDMTCLENIIKVCEKISYENAFGLLENNTFMSLLNVIDFLGEGQKKSVMKTCLNMAINLMSAPGYVSYIQPALPILSTLTQYNENDLQTTSSAILIFYYITTNMRTYAYNKTNPGIEKDLLDYCFLESMVEIVRMYLLNQSNKIISTDLIKTIIKIFQTIASMSDYALDKLLGMKVLHIIIEMLQMEFMDNDSYDNSFKASNSSNMIVMSSQGSGSNGNINNNNSNSTSSKHYSFLNELFPLITSFYPFDSSQTKIMSEKNKGEYTFFLKEILTLLIKQIMLKSACSTLSSFMKLLIIVARNATKEIIIEYMDDIAIAQILGKLVDTKYLPYLSDIITLTDLLMEKAPSHFIVSFMREGIVENLKQYKFPYKDEKKIQAPLDQNTITKKQPSGNLTDTISNDTNNNPLNSNMDMGLGNEYSGEEILDEEEQAYADQIQMQMDLTEEEYAIQEAKEALIQKQQQMATAMKVITNVEQSIPLTSENPMKSKKDQIAPSISSTLKTTIASKDAKSEETIFKEIAKEFQNTTNRLQTMSNLLSKENYKQNHANIDPYHYQYQQPYLANIEIKHLDHRLKDLLIKHFTPELINQQIKDSKSSTDPIEIATLLSNLNSSLNSNDLTSLQTIIDLLSNEKHKYTLFELENSAILIALCKYLDPTFITLYDKASSDVNVRNVMEFPYIMNKDIFPKVKQLIDCFKRDRNKISAFITMLQYTITSMNCFTMNSDEAITNNLNQLYNNTLKDSRRYEMKVIYRSDIYEKISKDKEAMDKLGLFAHKLEEYHNAFSMTKDLKLLITNKSTFVDISSILLTNTGVGFETNDKYEVKMVFMLEIDVPIRSSSDKITLNANTGSNTTIITSEAPAKKILNIKMHWNIKDILKEMGKLLSKEDLGTIVYGLPVIFGLSYAEKGKEEAGKDTEKDKDKEKDKDNEDLNKKKIDKIEKEKEKDILKEKYHNTLITSKHKTIKTIAEINTSQIEQQPSNNDNNSNNIKKKPAPLQFIINPENIDQTIFEKLYHEAIIYNQSFYEIKRLMPSLFLLSILYFPCAIFNTLFHLENLFTTDELQGLFINPKVNLLISRASRDGYSVSRGTMPNWCKTLPLQYNFLSKFSSRMILFKVSFDARRSLINLQNYLKHYANESLTETSIAISKSMRLKIIVERPYIIDYLNKIFKDPMTSKFLGYLEFEYLNEIGNGIGPTLEFYSSVIDVYRNDTSLWYKTSDNSYYPIPLNNSASTLNQYVLLGFIIARALYDDRLLDMPFSRIFWDVVLNRAVPLKSIQVLDNYLGKTIIDFNEVIKSKQAYLLSHIDIDDIKKKEDLDKNVKYKNASISELGIYFTLPGYDNIELIPNGKNTLLTIDNIEEYVEMIYNMLFIDGIEMVVNSFRKGFNHVFPIESLKHFTSLEIEECICGSKEEKWDNDTLIEYIKPEHGITKSSRVYKDLLTFMCGLNSNEQKKFLMFVTGTSRLPFGGFKSLSPRLTVVKRTTEPFEKPDHFLPTVMTCQNYLKLPDYSTYDILKNKLTFAMNEGRNEFHLS